MDNAGYLFAVFAIIGAVLFVYVLSLIRRQQQLRRDIDLLKDMLDKEA